MSIDDKRRYAAAAFIALLLLSVFWPSPIVSTNRLWFHDQLDVDELSFLGREAPSWDAVFWCISGIFLLIVLQSADGFTDPREQLRTIRFDRSLFRRDALYLLAGAVVTALVWLFADRPMLAWAEGVQSDFTEDVIRLLNRL